MSITDPKTIDDMREYVKIRLGAPINDINVHDLQIDIQLRVALDLFNEIHYNSTEEVIKAKVITQADIDSGFFTMPPEDHSIIEVHTTEAIVNKNKQANSNYMLSWQGNNFQSAISHWGTVSQFDSTGMGLPQILYLRGQAKADAAFFQSVMPEFEFNLNGKRLHIFDSPSNLVVGNYIIYRVYELLEITQPERVWVDNWLRDYATCLVKLQWGINLTKFSGGTLFGEQIQVNGELILSEAKEEKEKLETSLSEDYNVLPTMLIG